MKQPDKEQSMIWTSVVRIARLLTPIVRLPERTLDKYLDWLYHGKIPRLIEDGQYDKALQQYLFIFEKSRHCSGWGGVRLSYVLFDIKRLAEQDPQAWSALVTLRDAREEIMRAGKLDYDAISEWAALNHFVDESRTLAFYAELKSSGDQFGGILKEIRRLSTNLFAEAGLYREYSKDELSQSLRFLQHLMSLNFDEVHAPLPLERELSAIEAEMRETMRRAVPLFQFMLAIDMNKEADELRKLVLGKISTGQAYSEFVAGAAKVGKPEWAQRLVEEAWSLFEPEELAPVNEAAKLIPNEEK